MSRAIVAIMVSTLALSVACAPTKQAKTPDSPEKAILTSSENIRTYRADYDTTFTAALDTLRRIEESGAKLVRHSEGTIIFKRPHRAGMTTVNVEKIEEGTTRVEISLEDRGKRRPKRDETDIRDIFFHELGKLLDGTEQKEITGAATIMEKTAEEKPATHDAREKETIQKRIEQTLRLKKGESFLKALSYEELVLLDQKLESLAAASSEKEQLSQRCAACYIDLARFYHDEKGYNRSAKALKIAISIDPDNAVAHCNLGEIYKHLGLYDDAILELQEAQRLDPELPDIYINFGILYDDYVIDDKKALENYRKYLELGGDDTQVSKWIAEIEKSR